LDKKETLEEMKKVRKEMNDYLHNYLDGTLKKNKEVHYELKKFDQLKLPLDFGESVQLRLF